MPKSPKPVISPGQGLLLLMEHYSADVDKTKQLEKLYLSGAANASEQQKIRNLLKDKLLAPYQISYDANVINDDPTRRYFETHLSYESLKHGLDKIELEELTRHTEGLVHMLPPDQAGYGAYVLNGELRPSDNNMLKEYADYIKKIKSGILFEQFTPENRAKIELIVKSSFLGCVNGWFTTMPLNIYGTGLYHETIRGKTMLNEQDTTRNQNLGLMKGYMPLAMDDIARGEQAIPLLKPSDQATFVEHAIWPAMNFDKMVHPFSNSISGTMLCQLRAIAKLRNDNVTTLTASSEKMEQYIRLFTAAMLFGSGGHSLNEFTAPLSLQQTKIEFQTTPNFDQISLESMFLTNNKAGFKSALKDTIAYNAMVLQRQRLHAQIKGEVSFEPTQPTNRAIEVLKYNQEPRKLINSISEQKNNYAQRISSQFFSSKRVGAQKNKVIQAGLNQVIGLLKEGNLNASMKSIGALKEQVRSRFGKTNAWGQTSESYALIESIENALYTYHQDKLAIKSQLSVLKAPTPALEKVAEGAAGGAGQATKSTLQ
jgi:hypothetical protein